MKYNQFNLALLLEAYCRKYFRVLVDAFLYQVSPIIYIFCKSLLTKILNFNLSRLPSYCNFDL